MAAVATNLDEVFKECRDMDASLAERLARFLDPDYRKRVAIDDLIAALRKKI